MKTENYNLTLGLVASLPQADSIKEFDTLARREGATLDAANADYTYRGLLPQFWKGVDAGVRAKTGVAFKTKPHPKEAGKTVRDETPVAYIQRVVALGKIDVAGVQAIADQVIAGKLVIKDGEKEVKYGITFDPSETPAGDRAVKPTKGDLAAVVELKKRADFADKLSKLNKATGSNLTAKSTDDEIAVALGNFRRELERKAREQVLGKL